jgi:hypothetical protein
VADLHFIIGTNQIICHGWPYSPPDGEVPEPGWSLYTGGAFNDHNPWHPVMPAVARYIQRVSFLMRQGQPANQVAVLLPTDDAWASFAPGRVTLTGEMGRMVTPQLMSAILSAGYNVDFIDADAINRLGIRYPILLLPPTDRIPLETLKKIQDYAVAGGKVISLGRRPSIDPEGKTVPEITNLSKQLFDSAKSTFVPDETHLANALLQDTKPDFRLATGDEAAKSQIGFNRRKLPSADIYFIANTSNKPVETRASFATSHKYGEQWDPDSGAAVRTSSQLTPSDVPIVLAPYESAIFVFTDLRSHAIEPDHGPRSQLANLSADWHVSFAGINKSVTESILTDWIADPSTIRYSGEAIYSRDFTLARAPSASTFLEVEGGAPTVPQPRGSAQAYYDPPIREGALVTINGQAAGALWHPPYRLEVSKLLKTGENHIEIRVYNTAINAWSALPPHDYGPLIAKYGDRFQMRDLEDVKPISSGILGPVRLVTQEAQ